MRTIARACWAESHKYRRTTAMWLALGVPVLVAGLIFVSFSQRYFTEKPIDWKWSKMLGFLLGIWVQMALPCGSAILIGLLWGLEHSSNQMKHVLVLPPSRSAFFMAKLFGVLAMLAMGTVLLCALIAGVCFMLGMSPLHLGVVVAVPVKGLIGTLPAICLVFWVAQRSRNFAWPVSLGMVGMILGLVSSQSDKYWGFVPWSWGTIAAGGNGEAAIHAIYLALAVSVALILGAWLHFIRADAPC